MLDWVEILYNITGETRLYNETSVVLLPSKKEALGNVILETFSFGMPVVAARYAPRPAEVIRPGGERVHACPVFGRGSVGASGEPDADRHVKPPDSDALPPALQVVAYAKEDSHPDR